jgi:hypothetical protein
MPMAGALQVSQMTVKTVFMPVPFVACGAAVEASSLCLSFAAAGLVAGGLPGSRRRHLAKFPVGRRTDVSRMVTP